ncbi:MAG: DNA-binding protein WhiA [Lachnospiraceae bacterium]|nr:DNA-binding protein WhiA [Lachnospiraceae bacterium]
MSFSSEVKQELCGRVSAVRHCQLAELAAILHFCGQFGKDAEGHYTIGLQTENEMIVRKCFTLLKKTFNIETDNFAFEDQMLDLFQKIGNPEEPVSTLLLKNACCQRAFLRGAFLSVGSISDPSKAYHLEFVCPTMEKAEQLRDIIQGFEVPAKIVTRKKYKVVYLKEGSGIVDLLSVMEAHVSLMNLENLRIVKEMRNSINRRVNCETANISKTVSAASRQISDIEFLRDTLGFSKLPAQLQEMAQVRLENPDAPLKDLGQLLDPPVGKSGVNHRLRKLCELAESVRN